MAAEPQCSGSSSKYLARVLQQCLQSRFQFSFQQSHGCTITVIYDAEQQSVLNNERFVIFTEDNKTWHQMRLTLVEDTLFIGAVPWVRKCMLSEVAHLIPMSMPASELLVLVFKHLFRGELGL